MSNLKNCPFCGGKGECYRTVVKNNGVHCDAVAVRCLNCGARTGYVLFDARKHQNGEEYDLATADWNKRV